MHKNNSGKFQAKNVAMISPLVSTLTSISICLLEEDWLSECPIKFPIKCKTSFYKNNVDGIFDFFNYKNMSTCFENIGLLTIGT